MTKKNDLRMRSSCPICGLWSHPARWSAHRDLAELRRENEFLRMDLERLQTKYDVLLGVARQAYAELGAKTEKG